MTCSDVLRGGGAGGTGASEEASVGIIRWPTNAKERGGLLPSKLSSRIDGRGSGEAELCSE
jgi:hypothetical protein